MPEPIKNDSDSLAELDSRLAARAEKIAARAARQAPKGSEMSALGAAMRVSADLIGGVVVGICLGYGLSWLWPDFHFVFLIGGGVLGIGVGLYNAWRSANAQFGQTRTKSENYDPE